MYVCMYVYIYIYMYLSLYIGYITNAFLQFSGDGGSPCSQLDEFLGPRFLLHRKRSTAIQLYLLGKWFI